MPNEETPNAKTDSPDNPKSWGQSGDLSRRDPDAQKSFNGSTGGGQAGGGAYPNPHTGKEGEGGREGFMGHGGQTEQPYHGPGQLGDEEGGENPNSATRDTGSKQD
jgi:hypothetical protein